MKGTVYSGIVFAPEHPFADLHGLIRVCIRERSWGPVTLKLQEAFGTRQSWGWNCRIWNVSKSNAECLVTEGRYGELFACRIMLQYLDPMHYKPVKQKNPNPAEVGIHTGLPPKEL